MKRGMISGGQAEDGDNAIENGDANISLGKRAKPDGDNHITEHHNDETKRVNFI